MKPYLIFSDPHFHNWSQFSTTTPEGLNSRLKITIDEMHRAVSELIKRGGDVMYIGGDLFHVRGSIDPEVFNPVHEAFRNILARGVTIFAIPGNHDLAGKDTTEIGNAFQSFGSLAGFHVVTQGVTMTTMHNVLMIPWQATKDQLREVIANFRAEYKDGHSDCDLIIHVGIDGVLPGVPDAGLSAAEVASWGFRRVFAGDYHNHKIMEDGKVISIGATTHQNWGDIGSKAGFLIVDDENVEFHASHAPSFIELTADDDEEDIPLLVDQNYVRIRGMKMTDSEIHAFRENLEEMGARGVSFQVTRETVSARGASSLVKAASLDESVDKFIDQMTLDDPTFLPALKIMAKDVLTAVRSVTE